MLGRRLLTIILTTIVPTVLLNVISYATNHFKVSITIPSDNILFSIFLCIVSPLLSTNLQMNFLIVQPPPGLLLWSHRYCQFDCDACSNHAVHWGTEKYSKCSQHHLIWTLYLPLLSVRWGMYDNLNFKPNNLVPPHNNLIKKYDIFPSSEQRSSSNLLHQDDRILPHLLSSRSLCWSSPTHCHGFSETVRCSLFMSLSFFILFNLFLIFLFCCCSSVYFVLL